MPYQVGTIYAEVMCSISLVLSVILIVLESCSAEQRRFPARFVLYYTVSVFLVDSTLLWGAFVNFKTQVQAVHYLCRVQGIFLQFVNWNCLGWWAATILVLYRGVVLETRFQPKSEKIFLITVYGTSFFFAALPLVLEITFDVQIYSTIQGGTATRWCWLNSQCWMAPFMFSGAEACILVPLAIYATSRAGYQLIYNPSLFSYASKSILIRLFAFVVTGLIAYAAIFAAEITGYFQMDNATSVYIDLVNITALGGLGIFNFICFAPKHLCPTLPCCFCCFSSFINRNNGSKQVFAADSLKKIRDQSQKPQRKSSGSYFKFSNDSDDGDSISSNFESASFASSRPSYGAAVGNTSSQSVSDPIDIRGPLSGSKPRATRPGLSPPSPKNAVYLIGEDEPLTPTAATQYSSSL